MFLPSEVKTEVIFHNAIIPDVSLSKIVEVPKIRHFRFFMSKFFE